MDEAEPTNESVEPVLVARDSGVLTLTLNRPRRKNALSGEMVNILAHEIEAAAMDDATRVVVINAVGPDFCSGIDLVQSNRSDRGTDPGHSKPRVGHMQRGFQVGAHRLIQTMAAAQVPIVSGVRGWAAGIGNMLALSADVVIATPSAKFWVPFVTKGFTPDSGNTWLLPRLVGVARAKEMIMRGKPVPGETAALWGLIGECVPEDELDAAVATVASEFAAAATVSVGLAKTLIHQNLDVSLAAGLQNEGVYEEIAIRSDDFKEGMRAFAGKRAPEYTGW